MNIFEGARRIALVVMGLAALTGLGTAYEKDPDVIIKYDVVGLGVKPIRSNVPCASFVDGSTSGRFETPKGRAFVVEICFKASGKVKKEIPYLDAGNGYNFVGDAYSAEVQAYMKDFLENSFTPGPQDYDEADSAYWQVAITGRLEVLAWFAVGIGCFWAFVCLVGWIARGFAGIPTGQDTKNG